MVDFPACYVFFSGWKGDERWWTYRLQVVTTIALTKSLKVVDLQDLHSVKLSTCPGNNFAATIQKNAVSFFWAYVAFA